LYKKLNTPNNKKYKYIGSNEICKNNKALEPVKNHGTSEKQVTSEKPWNQ